MKMKQRVKLLIILGAEFLAIAIMLLLIFFAGKKVYTVTFDLNGGTLLSGDPVQKVTQGQNATPPSVTKEGCYFLKWSTSYSKVTKDITVKAIWEYETTPGIEYTASAEGEDSNYCEITGCFDNLTGEVYIGAYHGDKKVLGIRQGAFANCEGITGIHLLDGILTIEDGAFEGCTNLETIELPSTVVTIGNNAFKDCAKLKSVELPADLKSLGESAFEGCAALEEAILHENLETIGANAFAGCTVLAEIILPESLETIGSGAFDSEEILIYAYIKEEEKPEGWADGWTADESKVTWEYVDPESQDEEEQTKKK